MIHAYRETYLDSAMSKTGDMFDYAINDCGLSGESFTDLFLCSPVCLRLETGDPAYVAGKSGVELASEVIGGILPEPGEAFHRSRDYWCGVVSCYYQWLTGCKYAELFRAVPYSEMLRLYSALHETDLTKTAEVFRKRMEKCFPETRLKRRRMAYGCSQGELAKRSGVSLRSIQMYEQRNKDINKAHADTILRLSKTLGCRMEDLIEMS